MLVRNRLSLNCDAENQGIAQHVLIEAINKVENLIGLNTQQSVHLLQSVSAKHNLNENGRSHRKSFVLAEIESQFITDLFH